MVSGLRVSRKAVGKTLYYFYFFYFYFPNLKATCGGCYALNSNQDVFDIKFNPFPSFVFLLFKVFGMNIYSLYTV